MRTMGILSSVKKNGIFPSAAWMHLKVLCLADKSHKDKYCTSSPTYKIRSIKQTSEHNKKKTESQIENELVVTGREGQERSV